jgi:hypothetical protein
METDFFRLVKEIIDPVRFEIIPLDVRFVAEAHSGQTSGAPHRLQIGYFDIWVEQSTSLQGMALDDDGLASE